MADQPLPEQPPDEAGTGLQAAGLQGGLQGGGLQGGLQGGGLQGGLQGGGLQGVGLQGVGLQGAGLQGAGLQGLMPPLIPVGAQHPSLGAQHPSKLQALTPTLTRTIR